MTDDEHVPVYVTATLSFSGSPEVEVRQVMLGLVPGIFIEPVVTEESVTFAVTAHDIEQEDLVMIMRLLADEIETAEARPA